MKPERFWIIPHVRKAENAVQERTLHDHPVKGNGGMAYEADEVARCIRDGRLESERMTWEESRIVQSWFDRIRKDGKTVLNK
jgi:hypothetical protein